MGGRWVGVYICVGWSSGVGHNSSSTGIGGLVGIWGFR